MQAIHTKPASKPERKKCMMRGPYHMRRLVPETIEDNIKKWQNAFDAPKFLPFFENFTSFIGRDVR